MTQTERRLYLISELLKEDKGSSAFNFGLVSKNEGGFVIPDEEKKQRVLLRSLMNVRCPYSISDDFLKIQDEYLFCATSYLPLIFLRNMCFILLAPLFTQEWESVKKIVFNVFGNKDLEIYKNVLCQKW